VTIASGLPASTVVGLPDKAVAESRERVRAALGSLGLGLPPRRITVNLAPADVLKEGSHFDLPIALALLAAMEALPADELGGYTALGEVALDGSLTSVAGVLLAALAAAGRGSGVRPMGAFGFARRGNTLADLDQFSRGLRHLAAPHVTPAALASTQARYSAALPRLDLRLPEPASRIEPRSRPDYLPPGRHFFAGKGS
jgi:hypothetical protein